MVEPRHLTVSGLARLCHHVVLTGHQLTSQAGWLQLEVVSDGESEAGGTAQSTLWPWGNSKSNIISVVTERAGSGTPSGFMSRLCHSPAR